MFSGGAAGGAIGASRITSKNIVKIKERINSLSEKTSLNNKDKKFIIENIEYVEDIKLISYMYKKTKNEEKNEVVFKHYNDLKKNKIISTNKESDKLYKRASFLYNKILPVVSTFTLVIGFICLMPFFMAIGDIIMGTALNFEYYFVGFWFIPLILIYLCTYSKTKFLKSFNKNID